MFTLTIILITIFITFRLSIMFYKIKLKTDINFILDVIEGNEIYLSRKRNKMGFGSPIREQVEYDEGVIDHDYQRDYRSARSRKNFNDDEEIYERG